MNTDQESLLNTLKEAITSRAADTSFVHHKWFVQYHLEIVEKIANELCGIYIEADRFMVMTMVWLHDYEKIVDFDNEHNTELEATKMLMIQLEFESEFVEQMVTSINVLNAKEDLPSAAIEIQIVSSADGASHSVGPFMCLYWYENPHLTIQQLMDANIRKVSIDWEKKITLPEVREAFSKYRDFNLQVAGQLPDIFLS